MDCPTRERILEAVNATGDAAEVLAHVQTCASCRALYDGMMSATEILSSTPPEAPAGPCLDPAVLASYARRSLPPARERETETHLAACAKCRDEIVALVEALDGEAGEAPGRLEGRLRALSPSGCPSKEDLFDAAHGEAEVEPIESHAAACAPCRGAWTAMKKAASVFRRTPYAAAAGRCLDDLALATYARRTVLPAREEEIESHLASCASCRGEVAALVDALEAEPGEIPESLARRVRALAAPQAASSARHRRPATHRFRRRETPALLWAAAAAVLIAVLVLLMVPKDRPTERPVVKPPAPRPQLVKEEPKKEAPALPKKEEPKLVKEEPRIPEPPKKEEPKVAVEPPQPRKEDPAPAIVKEAPKKEEPKPAPPEKETKVEVKVARYVPVRVQAVHGLLQKKSGGAVAKGAELARGDEVFTGHRHLAAMAAEGGFTVTFEKSSAVTVEQQEGGETRVTLQKGKAVFAVEKRPHPFVVGTPSADVVVVGTAFQVEADEKHTLLTVVEGTVRFKNEKGEVVVNAGQRSLARPATKPTAPARVEAALETAWARRPDLAGDPRRELWIEHAAGGNRKLPGLVIAAPYYEGEYDSGRLAKVLAESMDVGLLLGHNHRDTAKKVWMNIDRATECEVRDDGTRGPAQSQPRMKKLTEEYLEHLKAAAGLGPKQAVPMVVCLRDHSYTAVAGGELEICEVAWTGFQRRTIVELKALYAQLLEKHRPAYRMEMRFEGLDDTYMHKGMKQTFQFTESDAESDGYLAPRHSQSSMTFFLNPSFAKNRADLTVYSQILQEMIEFLWARRTR